MKTEVMIVDVDVEIETSIKYGDKGFIDGYVMGKDGMVRAIFVRTSDGFICDIPLNKLLSITCDREK